MEEEGKSISEEALTQLINHCKAELNNGYTKSEVDSALEDKVDKVENKGLSTNDYTTEEKEKLENIEENANVNLIESISVDGKIQDITDKNVNISMIKPIVVGETLKFV